MERKEGSNWRQIFKGPEVEYCSLMKLGSLFPFYAKDLKIFEQSMGNASFNCPWQPGPYKVMNYSVLTDKTKIDDVKKLGVGIKLPNGIYRYSITFRTKKDPSSFSIQWRTEIRDRLGEEDF
jgi:hypothetical protein